MIELAKIRVKLAMTLVVVAIVVTLLRCHVNGINGPWFFPWPWRTIPNAWRTYAAMILAAVPLFVAILLPRDRRGIRVIALSLLVISCFGLKLASLMFRDDVTPADSPNLQLIQIIIEDRDTTSYYTDAFAFGQSPLRTWITLYPEVMSRLNLHSRSKPPGPILFWWILSRLMGPGSEATIVGGLIIMMVGAMAIPATYWLLQRLLHDEPAAFFGAAFLALCPGSILFPTFFDPAYILLSTALIGTWHLALSRDCPRCAILLGLTLVATSFITFNVLVIGLFMLGLVPIARGLPLQRRIARASKHALVAVVSMFAALVLLFLLVGYDPIATFRSAWANQHELLRLHAEDRPYPLTIPFDLTDFALGSGWISVVLVIFWFASKDEGGRMKDEKRWIEAPPSDASSLIIHPSSLVLLTLLQLLAVAALGLLQSETARVWNFMLPLLIIPVGLELRRWPGWGRTIVYGCLLVVTIVTYLNLKFVY
jgi:hypothetical protein